MIALGQTWQISIYKYYVKIIRINKNDIVDKTNDNNIKYSIKWLMFLHCRIFNLKNAINSILQDIYRTVMI